MKPFLIKFYKRQKIVHKLHKNLFLKYSKINEKKLNYFISKEITVDFTSLKILQTIFISLNECILMIL